jgi:hypothetical protein
MDIGTALSAVLCLAVMGAAPALASGATTPTTKVELIGGDTARSIPLDADRLGAGMTMKGELRLAVRNASAGADPVRVRLRYQPGQRRSSILLPGTDSTVAKLVGRDQKADGGVAIGRGAVHVFTVAFSVEGDAQASALNGAIDVETLGRGDVGTSRLEVPVTAALRPFGDVRFDPSSVVAQTTRGCPLAPCNATNLESNVVLRGAGVGALLAELDRLDTPELTTTLRRDDGRPVQATLSQIESDPARAATATARLTLDEKPNPGKYTGKLPVSTLVANAPALPIEVRSRLSIVWAVVLIFLGLFISGGALVWTALRRRKDQLRTLIRQAVGEYQVGKARNKPGGPYDETPMWVPPTFADDLRQKSEWRFNDPLDSPSAMYTAIDWARNDADLDEVESKAVELALAVKEWRTALAQVLVLCEILAEERPSDDEWRKHAIVGDTDLLLRRARHQPADAAAQAKLMAQVAQQTRWYRHCVGAWDLQQQLEGIGGLAKEAASRVCLDAILDDTTPALMRTAEQQDTLDVKLEATLKELSTIKALALKDGHELEDMVKGPSEGEIRAESYRAELEVVRSAGTMTPVAAAGLRPTAVAAATANALTSTLAADPGRATGASRVFQRYHLTDIALSFGVVLATALIYSATVYDDTWGSLADLATAFGAGLLGKVTVQWTLLPIFRSVRMKAAGVTDGADTTAQAAAMVAGVAS